MSLTNEPRQLIETAVDAIIDILGVDCCWVQLVSHGSNKLSLIACRGFDSDMKREVSLMDAGHLFGNEIVGLGNRIVIPDLSQDGRYSISTFEKAGFSSLIAMPIMTYKIHGIMGFAYRVRKKFNKDFSDFLAVVANLIGMALNKSMLHKLTLARESESNKDNPLVEAAAASDCDLQDSPAFAAEVAVDIGQGSPGIRDGGVNAFREHNQRMRIFSESHRALS